MSSPSKNKGKGFEREIAKHLTKITGINFQRVPNSGAMVGGFNIFRTGILTEEQINMFEGDIIPPKEWNHVRLECKFYKKMSWGQLFNDKGDSELNKWIEQAKIGTKPLWFLCFKINRIGCFIVFDIQHKNYFKFNRHMIYDNYIICTMDNFFEQNKQQIDNFRGQNEQSK